MKLAWDLSSSGITGRKHEVEMSRNREPDVSMTDAFVILGILATFLGGMAMAVRRFARRRRREGKWNASGPVDPTVGPPNPVLRAKGIHPPTIERE